MKFIYKIVEAWRRGGDGSKRQQLFHGTSQTLKKTSMKFVAKQI
jgi:hypothetical protein